MAGYDRHAFRPAGGDVGQHQRLHEAAGRRSAAMGHEVDLDEARWRIVPITKRADGDRPPHGRAETRAAPTAAASDEPHLARAAGPCSPG